VRDWANRWVALGSFVIGTPPYNSALEAITEEFVKANADPAKPNGSALNQLRTNEIALASPWELREFTLAAGTHMFAEVTTKQTPDETLNGQTVIAKYVNANAMAIKLDQHTVPDHFPGATDPFLAATSRASSNQFDTHFKAPGITDFDARFHFSLHTCTACHIRETSTNGTMDGIPGGNTAFLHVDPQQIPAVLSRFLTGKTPSITDSPDLFSVTDPVSAVKHDFNDLDFRRHKLASIAGSSCFRFILVPPHHIVLQIPRRPPGGPPTSIRDPRLNGLNDPLRMTH